METGVVFDVKEFAVYDGPGMRQTVFLKGCPLRCSWCHNPEGLSRAPQLMASTSSCIHCGRCAAVCTHHPCTACGACVEVCPLNLRHIAGTRMTSDALAQTVRKRAAYYARYGGGVTFSGGEPLYQPAFLLETLEKLSDLHRAIETSGYAAPEVFQKVVAAVDFVMMDIKLMDAQAHKRYTGVDNAPILANARWLCGQSVPFVLRIPVIPGVNDTEENFSATAELAAGAPALQRVELLPYHKTAGAKYEMVGMEYRPAFDPQAAVRLPREIFAARGVPVEIL